jgi:hypothetical protein
MYRIKLISGILFLGNDVTPVLYLCNIFNVQDIVQNVLKYYRNRVFQSQTTYLFVLVLFKLKSFGSFKNSC